MQALEHGVAAFGQDLVERHGDLPAKLVRFALDRAHFRFGSAVAPSVRSVPRSSMRILTVVLTELGAQGTYLLFRRKMMFHDSSQTFGSKRQWI